MGKIKSLDLRKCAVLLLLFPIVSLANEANHAESLFNVIDESSLNWSIEISEPIQTNWGFSASNEVLIDKNQPNRERYILSFWLEDSICIGALENPVAFEDISLHDGVVSVAGMQLEWSWLEGRLDQHGLLSTLEAGWYDGTADFARDRVAEALQAYTERGLPAFQAACSETQGARRLPDRIAAFEAHVDHVFISYEDMALLKYWEARVQVDVTQDQGNAEPVAFSVYMRGFMWDGEPGEPWQMWRGEHLPPLPGDIAR